MPVKTNVRLFLDLGFIRMGKDPVWTPEAGRPSERTGVAFFLVSAPLKVGDWIKMTKGPEGVFEIGPAVDEPWRPTSKHHLEVSVREIPKAFAAGQPGAPTKPAAGVEIPVPAPKTIPVPSPDDLGSL